MYILLYSYRCFCYGLDLFEIIVLVVVVVCVWYVHFFCFVFEKLYFLQRLTRIIHIFDFLNNDIFYIKIYWKKIRALLLKIYVKI